MSFRTIIAATVTTVAIALAVACGGGGDADQQSASDFAEDTLTQFSKGQWGRTWDTLHPAHQAVASRDAYLACRGNTAPALENITAEEEYAETLDVAELGQTATTAVTLSYDMGDTTGHLTLHFIDVDGAWRWIMPSEDVEAYRAGTCP